MTQMQKVIIKFQIIATNFIIEIFETLKKNIANFTTK